MKPKIVVTGAAGFIGSNLCNGLMEHGYEIVGIDNLSAGTRENVPNGVDFRKVDINDPDLWLHLKGCETVFHLAAKNCLLDCANHPLETAKNNVIGSVNLILAMVKAGVGHIVYADTSAEYEGILEFPSRTNSVKPLSVYATSKRSAALICESLSRLHGFTITTVRYFNVYGPAQDFRRVVPPVMSAFAIKLLTGERPTIYGSGLKSRDFIHVDDINSFHIKLLQDKSLRGRTYNLGSGISHSIIEIFELIESTIRSGIKPIFQPDLPGEAERTQADITETLQTGWKPLVSMEDGIGRFVEYTKNRLAKENECASQSRGMYNHTHKDRNRLVEYTGTNSDKPVRDNSID